MKKKITYLFCFLVIAFSVFSFSVFAEGAKDFYQSAVDYARRGENDFAFMNFNSLLTFYPDSKYRQQAFFALGEYYFSISNYREASEYFTEFLISSPEPKAKIFALAYLFKITKTQGDKELIKKMKKTIITQKRLSFIFKESKTYTYTSPLNNNYKADYFIDKVKFYLNDKFFTQVIY